MAMSMIGKRFGAYRVTRAMAEGGMSRIYEAVHETIAQRAVVKILHKDFASDPHYVQRFFNEACAIAVLRHPGLVQIFDYGKRDDGTVFMLMEYLEGESLAQRLTARGERTPLPLQESVRIARQIASALVLPHGKGIVHRDLKPDNVILIADHEAESGERVKLLDFGIAKVLDDSQVSGSMPRLKIRTLAGYVLGTPVYMSPEQCTGKDIGDRADVYSLGIMLFEMSCGRPPFEAENPTDVLAMHVAVPAPSLSRFLQSAPPQLVALVAEMLAKEPTSRPSIEQVAWRLQRIGERLAEAPQVSQQGSRGQTSLMPPVSLTVEAQKRNRRVVLFGALGAAVAFLGLVSLRVIKGPARPRVIHTTQGTLKTLSAPSGTQQPSTSPSPKQVRWTLVSTPKGADVIRASDGVLLGQTPWTRTDAKPGEQQDLLLRLSGHVDLSLTFLCQSDCEKQVVLQSAPSKKPRPKRPPGAVVDVESLLPGKGIGELPD